MTRTILRRTSWTLLIALLALFVALASWEPFLAQQPGPPPPPRAYSAEVIRDEWGVPHIHGKTDADVAFGTAWAHAEDDFSTLQDVVAMTRGRYGAIAGADGAGVDCAGAKRSASSGGRNTSIVVPSPTRERMSRTPLCACTICCT